MRVAGFRRRRVEEVRHAIRLEEQRELNRVRRDVDPVVRAVVFGRPVVRAADALEPVVEFIPLVHCSAKPPVYSGDQVPQPHSSTLTKMAEFMSQHASKFAAVQPRDERKPNPKHNVITK